MLKTRVFVKKLAVFSVLALFGATAIGATTSESQTITSGHVTWTTVQDMDKCYAAIAGIASNRVLWFNDQVLAENFALEDRYIYVTEANAPDPRDFKLAFVRNITFDDPNGVWWNVTEWQYAAGSWYENTATATAGPGTNVGVTGGERVRAGPFYVWTVELLAQPLEDLHRGPYDMHSLYNFVLIVDVCKFLQEETGTVHGSEENAAYEFANDPERPYREGFPDDPSHVHQTYAADIVLGGKPRDGGVLVPIEGETGFDNDHETADSFHPYTP